MKAVRQYVRICEIRCKTAIGQSVASYLLPLALAAPFINTFRYD